MSEKPEGEVKIVHSTYTEAQKNATKKYRANNKEKVNEQRKLYYKARKEKDPEFLEYKRQKAKEYYMKKKGETKTDDIPPPIKLERSESVLILDSTPVVSSESEPEVLLEPLQKPKLKRSKKKVKTETTDDKCNNEDKEPLCIFITRAIEELKIENEINEKPIDEGLEALKEWRPTMIMIGSPPEETPEKKTKKHKKEKKDKFT
jgi:hypothetical protein